MNAFYVTVSIPLLLVLAGFNHAHGLSTFGKSNSQGQGNVNQAAVAGKSCNSQSNCTLIKGTTCLRGYCLCGDNTHPTNGQCSALKKGPNHICQDSDECVKGAICTEPTSKPNNAPAVSNSNNNILQTCQCTEGLPTPSGQCSGGTSLTMIPGLIVLLLALTKTY